MQFTQAPGATRPTTDGTTLAGIQLRLRRSGRYNRPYEVAADVLSQLALDVEASAFDRKAQMIGVTLDDGRKGWMVSGVPVVAVKAA